MKALVAVLCGLLVAACAPDPESGTEDGPGNSLKSGATFLLRNAALPYYGATYRFPAASVEVLSADLPYARLFPQGSTERFDYFIELGRSGTAQPKVGVGGRIGFWSFGRTAVMTPLANGYQLWCEPLEGERGACAVLLREAPLAALLFPIVSPPSDAQAIEAVRLSEDYLRKAKQ